VDAPRAVVREESLALSCPSAASICLADWLSLRPWLDGHQYTLSFLHHHKLGRAVSNLFEFLDVAPHKISSGKRAVPERLQSGIEFRGVSFRYPGTSEMVLQDLNLFLKAGECVALVGHNGAGKTRS
jgi:ABC-type multidrug transport system fused ATPase/permease subunit